MILKVESYFKVASMKQGPKPRKSGGLRDVIGLLKINASINTAKLLLKTWNKSQNVSDVSSSNKISKESTEDISDKLDQIIVLLTKIDDGLRMQPPYENDQSIPIPEGSLEGHESDKEEPSDDEGDDTLDPKSS